MDAQGRAGGTVRVGFAICDPGVSFGALVGLGARERAAELGADLSIVSVFTPEQQVAVLQQFLARRVDVVIVEGIESEIVAPVLQKIRVAGIPVIVADMRIHGVEASGSVHSANEKGGEIAAGFLVEQLRGQGTIAHLRGLLTSDNGIDRSRGFHNVVDAYSGIRIVEAHSQWPREEGAAAVRSLLAAHPRIDAVFANSDSLALGAIDAIEEAGRTGQIAVVGFDAMPGALLAVARGTMAATVRQMPEVMGRLAIELALRVHAGEKVPTVVETDVTLVTQANVAEASLETLPLFPPILNDLMERGAELAEERTLLRTLIDYLPDLIYVKDVDSRFVLVNEAAAAYLGAGVPNGAVGKSNFDVFLHQYALQFRADEEAMLSSGQPLVNHEERIPAANGTTRWFSTTKVPTLDASGRVSGLVGMSRDITRQKESEAELTRLIDEQAALRRVAELVAQGASPDELFSAVAAEVAGIIQLPFVAVNRYEADRTFTVLGTAGEAMFAVGSRWPVENAGIGGAILATGQPARWDDHAPIPGQIGEAVRKSRLGSAVGAPIVVEGRTWGFLIAGANPGTRIPADAEQQFAQFTALVATAVSNASARTELLRSRARLVGTADETRRRLERDLHDGIQQWLVALALRARRTAGQAVAGESFSEELSSLADELIGVTDELRKISHGIHPAILSDAGLDDALASLARRSAVRVDLDVAFRRRYDPTVEATVYYVVAECITNAVKHAQGSVVSVRGGARDEAVEIEISDDGAGGADPGRGSGLLGLEDRVDTLGGTISIASPPGVGTTIRVRLPAFPHDAPFGGSGRAASVPSSG